MKRMFSSRSVLLVLVAVCSVAGCGKQLPPMAPVSGKVTVGGQPLTSGQVAFLPDLGAPSDAAKGGGEQTVGLSAGQISSDGTYKIFTAGKEGAPAGKYKVTVTPSMVPMGDAKTAPQTAIKQVYQNPQMTPLRFEVIATPEAGRYDLKLSK
jgi:predicted small lipoprotein YifL